MSFKSTFMCTEPPKKKRNIVTQEGRALIVNVYNYLKEEYVFTMKHKDCSCDLSHLRNILRRTADATNVTIKTVANALSQDRRKNKQKVRKKQYSFEKGKKSSTTVVADVDKILKEIEEIETQTLADANDEDLEYIGEERIVVLNLGSAQTSVGNKQVDNTVKIWQPAEVKKEAEAEQSFVEVEVKKEVDEEEMEEVEFKTEVEEVEINWKETEIKTETEGEEDITWEEVEIKTEVEEEEIKSY